GMILDQQSSSGAFPSTVERGLESIVDETCFVTAWVGLLLLQNRDSTEDHDVLAAVSRACCFVESCESEPGSGQFRFYPRTGSTRRLPIELEPDADDTALAWSLLLSAGRRSQAEANRVLVPIIDANVQRWVVEGEASPRRPGLVRTWLGRSGGENPIDLTVNANVAALLCTMGLRGHWLYRNLVESLCHAVLQSGFALAPLLRLSPYYAHPIELLLAIDHAVRAGAEDLAAFRDSLRSQSWARDDDDVVRALGRPLCNNVHGRPRWRSPVLQAARAWAKSQSVERQLSSTTEPTHPYSKEVSLCT
ncbi:MAG: hypothetical protein K8J08_08860, partial [Thermoanaerobaculia bacterium]|nr:hypothetical protein [Thermoanaerobaculia bacterium]